MIETAIAEHGIIGDLQTAALVTTDGSIDWFCCPRFDSPSVFGALLDDERGGHFRIRPAARRYTTKQMYFPDTAVLVTRFFTEDGLGQVVDFMPPAGTTATDKPPARADGAVRPRPDDASTIDVAPRFDYGRHPHRPRVDRARCRLHGERQRLTLHVVREPDDERLAQVDVAGRATCTRTLHLDRGGDPRRGARVGGRRPARARSGSAEIRGAVRRDGRASGGRGWPARPTPAGGARASSARRSR